MYFFACCDIAPVTTPKQSFTAWMYQIARNASVDQAQKRRGEVVGIDEFDDRRPEPATDAPGPEEIGGAWQDLALLSGRSTGCRMINAKSWCSAGFNEMKYEEIAGVLGCEVGTVKVRVFRAMRALEQIYLALAKEKSA